MARQSFADINDALRASMAEHKPRIEILSDAARRAEFGVIEPAREEVVPSELSPNANTEVAPPRPETAGARCPKCGREMD